MPNRTLYLTNESIAVFSFGKRRLEGVALTIAAENFNEIPWKRVLARIRLWKAHQAYKYQ